MRDNVLTAARDTAAAVVSSTVSLLCEIAAGKIDAIMMKPMPSTTKAKRTSGEAGAAPQEYVDSALAPPGERRVIGADAGAIAPGPADELPVAAEEDHAAQRRLRRGRAARAAEGEVVAQIPVAGALVRRGIHRSASEG